jgi:hypothetical protein
MENFTKDNALANLGYYSFKWNVFERDPLIWIYKMQNGIKLYIKVINNYYYDGYFVNTASDKKHYIFKQSFNALESAKLELWARTMSLIINKQEDFINQVLNLKTDLYLSMSK